MVFKSLRRTLKTKAEMELHEEYTGMNRLSIRPIIIAAKDSAFLWGKTVTDAICWWVTTCSLLFKDWMRSVTSDESFWETQKLILLCSIWQL